MKNRITMISYGISVVIFLLITIWGLFGLYADDLAYVVMVFYFIIPITSFISALILGLKRVTLLQLYPIIFGCWAVLIPLMVFHNVRWIAFLFSAVPYCIGFIIGVGINWVGMKIRSR